MIDNVLIQALGVLGAIITAYSFTLKDDKKLKIVLGGGALILSSHFFLLGSFMGAVSAGVAGIRFLISAYYNNKRLLVLFSTFYIALIFLHDGNSVQYLPMIAGLLVTVALFFLSAIKLRMSLCVAQLLWLVHNIYYVSIGGIFEQTLQLLLNLRTMLSIKTQDGKKKHD